MRFTIPLIGLTLHFGSKNGGPESHVYMYGVECKAVGSILVLRFENGSREAYHNHAFNAVSAIINQGLLMEEHFNGDTMFHSPIARRAGRWIRTPRECCHKVTSFGRTWVLSLRGPWEPEWTEVDAATGLRSVLGYGRQVVH